MFVQETVAEEETFLLDSTLPDSCAQAGEGEHLQETVGIAQKKELGAENHHRRRILDVFV